MRSSRLPLVLLGVFVLILLFVLAVIFSDSLGARLIKKGSPRLTVRQGDTVTLELRDSSRIRKLEICVEEKNTLLGYADFSDCRPLHYFVGAHVTKAEVTIPVNFPLQRAVVITRLRDAAGALVPAAPTDEKIALWVVAGHAVQPVAARSEGGGGSGDGGGGGSGGGDRSGGNEERAQSEPQQLEIELVNVAVDGVDCEIGVRWRPKNTAIFYRLPGEERWHYHARQTYNDAGEDRGTVIFNPLAYPPFDEGYPLAPNEEFEFRFVPDRDYPDRDLVEPSEIYRFQTGPEPPTPLEYPSIKCTAARIFP